MKTLDEKTDKVLAAVAEILMDGTDEGTVLPATYSEVRFRVDTGLLRYGRGIDDGTQPVWLTRAGLKALSPWLRANGINPEDVWNTQRDLEKRLFTKAV